MRLKIQKGKKEEKYKNIDLTNTYQASKYVSGNAMLGAGNTK